MFRGLFITGTDTNVGKTVVAAALMHRYRELACLRYWKPIQTGIEQDDDTAVVQHLGECGKDELFNRGIRLPRPVSPHLAAQWSTTHISIPDLVEHIADESGIHVGRSKAPVESWCRSMSPQLMIDLMVHLSMPVLLVARSTLGTINHTLLTLEALRSRALDVAGVVMVGEPNRDNREAIEHFGNIAILGEMPHLPNLTPEAVREWATSELDPDGMISKCLR